MICVFSAPNYLDVYNNKGAVLQLGGGALKVSRADTHEAFVTLATASNVHLGVLSRITGIHRLSSLCTRHIHIGCQTLWMFSRGPYRLWPRKLPKCYM